MNPNPFQSFSAFQGFEDSSGLVLLAGFSKVLDILKSIVREFAAFLFVVVNDCSQAIEFDVSGIINSSKGKLLIESLE